MRYAKIIVVRQLSRAIYRQASTKTMDVNYLMFHTIDPYLAIENLKELYRQKKNR